MRHTTKQHTSAALADETYNKTTHGVQHWQMRHTTKQHTSAALADETYNKTTHECSTSR